MINNNILTFGFGVIVGGFMATVVLREAVPLRDHYAMIIISSILGFAIILGLVIWYFKLVSYCKKVFGAKFADFINAILSFLILCILLLFVIVVGIFYAAVA